MPNLCVTRAIKNARHLQQNAPHLVPREEPPGGFGTRVPRELLARLHTAVDPKDLGRVAGLAEALRRSPLPPKRTSASAPLFHGTLVFVQITFATARGSVAVNSADLDTAIAFARLVAAPISGYATQYGPNGVAVAPGPVAFAANVPGGTYNDQTLQGWVNAIVSQNRLTPDTCVVILNPPGVVNTDADPKQGVGGYHGFANVPYAFVNVMGTGLTVKDEANLYALALSHEIAEMVVDPRADLANPEIADPCGPNCQTVWIDYFDASGRYLQTLQAFPPPFPYGFFINAIVKPSAATQCPAPGSACDYPPP
ncbi:MAG TPA: hypothetical protein VEY12_04525 [Thermoplasmata archaeon]|nr:hypothetical protein [Thermoplasmata archaeon]